MCSVVDLGGFIKILPSASLQLHRKMGVGCVLHSRAHATRVPVRRFRPLSEHGALVSNSDWWLKSIFYESHGVWPDLCGSNLSVIAVVDRKSCRAERKRIDINPAATKRTEFERRTL